MKPSIFVVEDDPDISRLVRHHLEADGFTVKVFAAGNTVIAESERQRPALFILDIMVPGKDGLELCRQIRKAVQPTDIIEEIWLNDVAYFTWEIARFRRMKTTLITTASHEGLRKLLNPLSVKRYEYDPKTEEDEGYPWPKAFVFG